MKKLALLIVHCSLLTVSSHAASPCAWVASHPWKSNDPLYNGDGYDYTCNPACGTTSSSADATWNATVTNALGRSGSISGQSRCSTDGTTNPPVANNSTGQYCWCRVTSIVDSTAGTCPADSNGAPWVFAYNYLSAANCRQNCADFCAFCVLSGSYYSCSRSALLTLPTLICPSGSSEIDDNSYMVVCGDTCPANYVKVTDDPEVAMFEAADCDDKGESTMTCTAP